jgi:hypothetical protein
VADKDSLVEGEHPRKRKRGAADARRYGEWRESDAWTRGAPSRASDGDLRETARFTNGRESREGWRRGGGLGEVPGYQEGGGVGASDVGGPRRSESKD